MSAARLERVAPTIIQIRREIRMADLDLNELISVEHREALAAMWPGEKEAAAAEVRQLLEWVSKPAQHLSDTQKLVRRLFHGLVGEVPDPGAWLQAAAVGSLQLRSDQRYVIMRANEKPARFIERGLKTYDEGVSGRQRWAGITDAGVKQGMHLVGFSIIAKELKNLASGPAALGPAWPLMVAIDTYLSNEEKRVLHAAGANEELQLTLADAVKAAVAEFLSGRGPNAYSGSRAADWRRELPPGTDVKAYFETKKAAAATSLGSGVPHDDHRLTVEMILNGPRPSFLPMDPAESSPEIPNKLKMLLPRRPVDLTLTAYRALARRDAREVAMMSRALDVQTDDFKVQVWLCEWARRGGGVTADFPTIYFLYLVEEACLAYAKDCSWVGAPRWQNYGVLSDDISFGSPEDEWSFGKKDAPVSWVDPQ